MKNKHKKCLNINNGKYRKALMKPFVLFLILTATQLLIGCEKKDEYLAGNLHGFNHVKGTSVNWFKVNGAYGRGGGGTCCIMVPAKWIPGQKVLVEWEVDPDAYSGKMPSFNDPTYSEYVKQHKANYRHYSKMVEVPKYDEPCSMKVHFLPCQEVKVTLSCKSWGHPDYPINEPSKMEEPTVCPTK